MDDRKEVARLDFAQIFARFQAPIAALDCGERCAPYNEYGVPFCCDTRHVVPTAYDQEWEYLRANTDLWHVWSSANPEEEAALQRETPEGQVLIECRGHRHCQRGFRSLTCRAFPFFPYINQDGEFIGLSYYWEYEEWCWVINNLQVVTPAYRAEFVAAFDAIFASRPDEFANFQHHSAVMCSLFARRRRAIPLLHRNGLTYKVTPQNGRLRRVAPENLPKFGPYKIAAELPFFDEICVGTAHER